MGRKSSESEREREVSKRAKLAVPFLDGHRSALGLEPPPPPSAVSFLCPSFRSTPFLASHPSACVIYTLHLLSFQRGVRCFRNSFRRPIFLVPSDEFYFFVISLLLCFLSLSLPFGLPLFRLRFSRPRERAKQRVSVSLPACRRELF